MLDQQTILILEDEALIANHLKRLLEKNNYTALVALDLSTAYQHLKEGVDLALVDMNLQDKTTGIELGQKLMEEYHIPFIYITANEEPSLMHKALETSPSSYLTKPFNTMDVLASVKLALKNKPKPEEMIQVQDGSSTIRFRKQDLKYALTDGNYIKLVTGDKHHLVRNTMDHLLESLVSDDFYRIHRTSLVNLRFVESFSTNQVSIDQQKLPLARSRKKGFIDLMNQLTKK